MPNRDHDDSLRNRSGERLPSRDGRSTRGPGDRGESTDKRQDYAPEWRSYAQDWGDPRSAQSNAEQPEDWVADNRAENPFHAHERTRQEWNRSIGTGRYARESYGPTFGEPTGPGEAEGWGQQLRLAGQHVVSRVKRVLLGPRVHRRSDERIHEDVREGLVQQQDFDPSDLDVWVTSGEVTLTGTVRSRPEKFVAEEIAGEVSGVHEVHNQIRVRRLDLRAAGANRSAHVIDIAGAHNRDVPRA